MKDKCLIDSKRNISLTTLYEEFCKYLGDQGVKYDKFHKKQFRILFEEFIINNHLDIDYKRLKQGNVWTGIYLKGMISDPQLDKYNSKARATRVNVQIKKLIPEPTESDIMIGPAKWRINPLNSNFNVNSMRLYCERHREIWDKQYDDIDISDQVEVETCIDKLNGAIQDMLLAKKKSMAFELLTGENVNEILKLIHYNMRAYREYTNKLGGSLDDFDDLSDDPESDQDEPRVLQPKDWNAENISVKLISDYEDDLQSRMCDVRDKIYNRSERRRKLIEGCQDINAALDKIERLSSYLLIRDTREDIERSISSLQRYITTYTKWSNEKY